MLRLEAMEYHRMKLKKGFGKTEKLDLKKLLQKKKQNTSNYDCLIPVSGGKDSYYQAHVICKEYDLNLF